MNWAKKIMGCVSEYIDQRGKNMGYKIGAWTDPRAQQNAAQLQQQYNNALAQQIAQTQQVYSQSYSKSFGTMFGSNLKLPTLEQLDDPDSVHNLPLEALATMWGARFGYRWVPDEATIEALEENEDMWLRVVKRLYDAGMLVHEQYRCPENEATKVAWRLIEKDHGNR